MENHTKIIDLVLYMDHFFTFRLIIYIGSFMCYFILFYFILFKPISQECFFEIYELWHKCPAQIRINLY